METNFSMRATVSGRWRMVSRNGPICGHTDYCRQNEVIWVFKPSAKTHFCGRLTRYENDREVGWPIDYCCNYGSVTLCKKIIYTEPDHFDWDIRIYHYQVVEKMGLLLRWYDPSQMLLCKHIPREENPFWSDCMVRCMEMLSFDYAGEGTDSY